MPKFSVIIPVYKAEKNIEKLANQILSSDLDIELILVNDGSPDNSKEVIENLQKKDNRIILINQKNSGPSIARNEGIKKSSGDFIIFCDSDDKIIPENFEKALKNFKNNDSDIYVFGWKIRQKINNNEIFYNINLKSQLLEKPEIIEKTIKSLGEDGRMYNLWNKIYKSSTIKNNNILLDENLRFGEDLLFNMEIIKKSSKITIENLKPYYIYEEDSPTSIVSETKLNHDFRIKNSQALRDFSSHSNDSKIQPFTQFVQWRWFASYCIAIAKSNQKILTKIKNIKLYIKNNELEKIKDTSPLSRNKKTTYTLLSILSKTSLILLISIILAVNFRKITKKHRSKNITLEKI